MADEIKNAEVEELKGLLFNIEESAKARGEAIKTTGEDVSELKQKQVDAAKELEVKFTAMEERLEASKANEAKVAEMEKTIARMEITGEAGKEGLDQKSLDMFNLTRSEVQSGGKSLSLEEAKELKAAYDMWICGKGDMLTSEQKTLVNTIIDPQGGYITAPQYDQTIINKAFDMRGVLGLIAKKNTVTGEYKQAVDYADYDKAEYLNELANGVADEHDPDYKLITWNATEQIYKMRITRNELEDAFLQGSVDTDILGKMRAGAERQSAAQVLVGNGVDRPRGILDYADGTDYDKIERVTGFASTSISWEDVITLLPKELKDPYHMNASYAMNRRSFFDLLTDEDSEGQLKLMNQINFFTAEGMNISIMGHAVKFDAGLADSSTANNEAVIFGDFQEAYVFCERIGFSVIIDNVTSGQLVTYRLRRRNDGRLRMGDALKILKIKA